MIVLSKPAKQGGGTLKLPGMAVDNNPCTTVEEAMRQHHCLHASSFGRLASGLLDYGRGGSHVFADVLLLILFFSRALVDRHARLALTFLHLFLDQLVGQN